jgi:hypothetical protein
LWKPGYRIEVFAFFCFTGGTPRQVRLVLPALRVREVGTIILVHC